MRDRLLLARLLAAGDKGVTEAMLTKDLLPVFVRALGSSADAKVDLTELIEAQLVAGNVERESKGKSVKYHLAAQARPHTTRWFPGTGKKTWASLKKGWLVVHALGLESLVSQADVAAFAKVTSLRLILINQHLELGLPVVPGSKAFDTALLWQTMRRGLSDEVFEWAKKRNPTLGMVLGALAASVGQVSPSAKKAEVYAKLAAKLAGARNAKDLHEALLPRLVAAQPGNASKHSVGAESTTTPTSAQPQLPPTAGAAESTVDEFAQRVLSAARRATTGKLDDSLVLINHVYDKYMAENPSEALSLDGFKERLMSAAIGGSLMLASADMPQTLDPNDFRASRIDRGASVYSLLRI